MGEADHMVATSARDREPTGPAPARTVREGSVAPLARPPRLRAGLGARDLVLLQRAAGNAATAMLVQRVSHANEIPQPITDAAAAARTLDGLSTPDLIDTLDELNTSGAASAFRGDPASLSALPPQRRDRITAVLHATGSMINPTFYIAWSHLDAADQGPVMARAERAVKGAGTAEHRIAVMGGGLIGMIRAQTYEEAFAFLNGLNMPEILTTSVSARGAPKIPTPAVPAGSATTLLDDLAAHIGDAKGVNVKRLSVAIEAARFDTGDYAAFESAHSDVNDPAVQPLEREDIKNFFARGGRAAFEAGVADPTLNLSGHNFWSDQISEAIMTDAVVVALNTPTSPPAHVALFTQLKTLVETANNAGTATAALQTLAGAFIAAVRAAAPPGAAQLRAFAAFVAAKPLTVGVDPGPFKKKGTEFLAGWGIYQRLNGGFVTAPTPDVRGQKNVFRLHYLSLAEPEVCGFQAGFVASRYRALTKRAGARDPDPKAKIGPLKLAKKVLPPDRALRVQDGVSVMRGDVCQYDDDLVAAIPRIKAALDGRWLVKVRLMSGQGGGGLAGEHSVLLIGYQGNAFTVSDTDPGNEGEEAMQTGFTTIYFDPAVPRFSTAVNDANFPVLASDPRLQLNRHHRYQVLSVTDSL